MRFPKSFSFIACVAVLVCGGLATNATAAEFEIEGTEPVTVVGEQAAPLVFTLEGIEVECEVVAFEGSMASIAQATLEVTPSYSGCQAFGFVGATVTAGSCKLKFLEPTGSGPFSGSASIVCTEGSIVVTAATCEVKIGAQGPVSGLTEENQSTTPLSLHVKSSMEGLTYNKTKDGFACPLKGTGVGVDGKYTGSADFEGSQGEAVAFGVSLTWMSANPEEVAFPNEIEVGKTDKKPLEFTFVGAVRKSINILDARIVNAAGTPFKIINNGCKKGKLVKGTPCKLEVEFAPEKKGAVTAEVIIEEDRILGRVFEVPVKGTGK
jgi:hypothetical protein